ncbi:LETM1 domain-containing protein 1 isoform X2 [Denticeps clupeoides]|uniref:Letm1 RBD domain-containing protein n=1 Tax=Denticeps clupeoides TaxID=299321 RepID=A0AAY4DBX1_9TELE|nr:LETM1 domain-containing protein 1-like isoform X2 [Denticeps clupeoides]
MALSCTRTCHGSVLFLLCGSRLRGVRAGLCSPLLTHSLTRLYSTSRARSGIGRSILKGVQWTNSKYEQFLQRRFPQFYVLYHTFLRGFRLLFQDAKDVFKIRAQIQASDMNHLKMSYHNLEKLRQFRRDMIKAIPLVVISIPPFANYLVFALMYLFPRQVLIRHFWTPQQLVDFQAVYHSQRAQHYRPVLSILEQTVRQVEDSCLQIRLTDLCHKVQNGGHPLVSEVHAVRSLFSGPPLGIKIMTADLMRQLCPMLFLTPRFPAFLIRQRLHSHALELMHLDQAIVRLGLHQLSDAEMRQACFVRGMNGNSLSPSECREWLSRWLNFSIDLKESETSLYLHSMVLLTVNFPKPTCC